MKFQGPRGHSILINVQPALDGSTAEQYECHRSNYARILQIVAQGALNEMLPSE